MKQESTKTNSGKRLKISEATKEAYAKRDRRLPIKRDIAFEFNDLRPRICRLTHQEQYASHQPALGLVLLLDQKQG